MPEISPRLRVLNRLECLALLGQARIGRIGLSIGALPVILPVNYCLLSDQILLRTSRGTKLAAATDHAVVAFEVDTFEADGSAGWSVLVRGIASEVTDPRELADARATPLISWAVDGLADHYVTITTAEISGRSFDRRAHPNLSSI
jgi:uncharacterized protein